MSLALLGAGKALDVAAASTNYATTVTTDTPISYWRLPAVTDSAGASPLTLTGTPASGASLITAGSGGNSSLTLDGVDDQASALMSRR